jgi:hypothetical protein
MAVNLSPFGGVGAQFLDNSGNVLTGGKILTYAAGTTTPQAAYTSSLGNTPLPNPIILNAAGRVPTGEIWLTDGLIYKFVLTDSNDVLIATYDNITGINSNFVAFTNEQEIQTATAGQTVFDLTTISYQPGTNSLAVFVDGVNQYGPGAQYAYLETDSDTVTFINGLHVGALVKFTTSALTTGNATNASVVAYEPPFTNSVSTNVEAKLAQTVSVKDFGAVGDGVADDTVAIQNALNSGAASVYVPAGIYLTSAPLVVNEYTTLYGENAGGGSQGSVIQKTGNATTPSHLFDSIIGLEDLGGGQYTYGVTIKALRLVGLSNNAYGLKLGLATHGHYEDITINNVDIGVDGTDVWLTNYTNVVCRNLTAGTYGFNIAAGTSNNFNRCWAKTFNGGYKLGFLNYSVLNGCACDTFTDFAYDGGAAVVYNGCGAESANLAVGGYVWGTGARSIVLNACQCLSISTATSAGQSSLFRFIGSRATINGFRLVSFTVGSLIDTVVASGDAKVDIKNSTLPNNPYRVAVLDNVFGRVAVEDTGNLVVYHQTSSLNYGADDTKDFLSGYRKLSDNQVQGKSTALTPVSFKANGEMFTNTYSVNSGGSAASVNIAQYTHTGSNSNSSVFFRVWATSTSDSALYQGYGNVINGTAGLITLTNVYGATLTMSAQFAGGSPNVLSFTMTSTFAKAVIEVTISQRESTGSDAWEWL